LKHGASVLGVAIALTLALTLEPALTGTAAGAPDAAQLPSGPDWQLKCADGGHVRLHEALAEGPVLVSFWALWCLPCLKELPHLNELAVEMKGQVTILAINKDSSKSVAKVRPYLHAKGYDLIVPLDTAGDVGRLLQVGAVLPFVVLYDSAGREVYRHVGYKEGDEIELRERILTLLGNEAAGEADDANQLDGYAEPEGETAPATRAVPPDSAAPEAGAASDRDDDGGGA
jgi:cytochrome c biogenesis protein CcmG/thiol:disulfide interchange protein DsbE